MRKYRYYYLGPEGNDPNIIKTLLKRKYYYFKMDWLHGIMIFRKVCK
jgi:hypothetical protein